MAAMMEWVEVRLSRCYDGQGTDTYDKDIWRIVWLLES